MEPGERYWEVVEPHWRTVDIYNGEGRFQRTFARVPQPAGHLLTLHWCQSEVCNGGFHQFFMNPTGVLAPEATRGFREIGMPSVADIVERAMAVFGSPYPREQEPRREFLLGLADKTPLDRNPFADLDSAFYDAIGESGALLYSAADEYASRRVSAAARSEPKE